MGEVLEPYPPPVNPAEKEEACNMSIKTNVFQKHFFCILHIFCVFFLVFLYFVILWFSQVFFSWICRRLDVFLLDSCLTTAQPLPRQQSCKEGQLMLTQWQNLVVCTSLQGWCTSYDLAGRSHHWTNRYQRIKHTRNKSSNKHENLAHK